MSGQWSRLKTVLKRNFFEKEFGLKLLKVNHLLKEKAAVTVNSDKDLVGQEPRYDGKNIESWTLIQFVVIEA